MKCKSKLTDDVIENMNQVSEIRQRTLEWVEQYDLL